MAASTFFHRKIFEEPNNSTEICTFQCDPLKNPTTICLPICSFLCPSNCNTTDPSPPPPPPPSPPYSTGDFFITNPPTHHHSSLSLPLKISIVVLILTFSFFLLYTLYKFYTIWYRRRRPPEPENDETNDGFVDHDVVDHPIWYIRTVGLQPSVISAINVVKYKKLDGLIDGTSCSVCLSDFVEDETLRLLPKCNHAFHVTCIDTWLRSHTNCPLCRAGIVKNVDLTDSSGSGSGSGSGSDPTFEEMRIVVLEEGTETNGDEDEDSGLRVGGEVGGSGSNENLNIRRSVSLNDYAASRIRNDVYNNNKFYSDRHEVEIQSVEGGLGVELVKVNRTAMERN